MAVGRKLSVGSIILQVGLSLYLIVSGIIGIQTGSNEGLNALKSLIGQNTFLPVVMAVCQLVAGILLLINVFNIQGFGTFLNIALLVIIVFWCIYIVLYDLGNLSAAFRSGRAFLDWLRNLTPDLIILGGLLTLKGI